jgi:hypothetical protein
MDNDRLMSKLKEAWSNFEESLVSRTPIEGPAIVEKSPTHITQGQNMYHNIEDQEKLKQLEAAWHQVDETNTNAIEASIVEVFNSLPKENLKVVRTHDGERDDGMMGPSQTWNVYDILVQLPLELQEKLKQYNDVEVDNILKSLLNEHSEKIGQFIQNITDTINETIESVDDVAFDVAQGEVFLKVNGEYNVGNVAQDYV